MNTAQNLFRLTQEHKRIAVMVDTRLQTYFIQDLTMEVHGLK